MKNLTLFLLFFALISLSVQGQTTLNYSGTSTNSFIVGFAKVGAIGRNNITTASTNFHIGLTGTANNATFGNVGVLGTTSQNTLANNTDYYAVYGDNYNNNLVANNRGVVGGFFTAQNSGINSNVSGVSGNAYGANNSTTTTGVSAIASNNSNTIANKTIAVRGQTFSGNSSISSESNIANPGGFFTSNDGQGIYATTSGGYTLTGFGEASQAVVGVSNLTGIYSNTGVTGYGNGSSSFKFGVSGYINGSVPTGLSAAIYGIDNINTSSTYAGFFQGKLYATGNAIFGSYVQVLGILYAQGGLTTSGTKNFTIDHPLDPENKILRHASIESNEVLNQYSGNITTDSKGNATVILPNYFEVLNKDFRYQLTVIRSFSQVIIKQEVSGNQFVIKSDRPNVKVSWQITGVRNDRNMQYAPFVAESEKEEKNKGKYMSPEAYGKLKSQGEIVAENVHGEIKNSDIEVNKNK